MIRQAELRRTVQTPKLESISMSVHLKIEDSSEGLMATISQRDGVGKLIGKPSVFLVGSKEEAKQQAKTLTRSLGLGVYGFVDNTHANNALWPQSVPGVGKPIS
jgi:hypothetical protein